MKNAVSARLFPLCDFLFARTDRPIRLYLLIVCLMLVYLPGYSRPEARCDTLGDAVVVFRPGTVADNNMPMVVTVTRAGEASSREDCIRQLEESPYDKQTVTRFNCDAVHAVRTAEAESRIRDAILSVVPEEKLRGIRHLVMGLILSPSGQIEWVSFYPTETMLQRWTAADYEALDRMLKNGTYYTSWDEPIPCCCLMESIPLADDKIHAIITVDGHFSKLTLLLTNRFEDKVWWSSSPLLPRPGVWESRSISGTVRGLLRPGHIHCRRSESHFIPHSRSNRWKRSAWKPTLRIFPGDSGIRWSRLR